MPISPLKLYCCWIVGELDNQLTVTRLWFRGGTSSPASTVTAEIGGIRSGIVTSILPAYRNFCSSLWHGNHLQIMEMTTTPRVMIDEVISVSGIGDAQSLPSFCAGVLSIRTGFSGRTRAGRLFLPGIPDGGSLNSKLTGASFGQLQAFGTTLLNVFGPSGTNAYGRWGVFSRKLGVTRSAGPPPSLSYSIAGWTQATEAIARFDVATMRKRKLGRGQ